MTRRALLLAGLAAVLAAGCGRAPESRPAPDVVIVTLDTLRPDHLGFHGYARETAPFLSELAARSSVFLDAVSTSSWTAPATASLFTGLFPTRHGVIEGFFAHERRGEAIERTGSARVRLNRMPTDVPTLPERFAAAGYATFGIGTNVNVGPEIGFARGFDRFRRLPLRDVPPRERARMVVPRLRASATAGEVMAALAAWEPELQRRRPFLLYLHLNDVHDPLRAREPWYRPHPDRLERRRSAYDSEIHYVDGALRRLYGRLVDDETLFVVLSDHGEGLGEHGVIGHGVVALWQELSRVLMLVHAPGLGVRAQRLRERVSLVDVLPTALDLAGLPRPADADGLSLAPLLRDAEGAGRLRERLGERSLLAHRARLHPEEEHVWALYRGPWKLVRTPRGTALYDLRSDPSEEHDLSERRPEVRARLERELQALRARSRAEPEEGEVVFDRETLENLRALGYVDEEETR